jgi:enolase
MYLSVPSKVVFIKPKQTKRIQKLKKLWKIQKQLKKEEKEVFREFWERKASDSDIDFEDLFDTF